VARQDNEVTRATSRALYYPLFLLLLIVVARSPVFDNWQWGVALVIALGLSAGVAVLAAWRLRQAAEHVRQVELSRLESKRVKVWNAATDADREKRFQLSRAIRLIKENKDGAFAPWHHRTWLMSVLIPVSGIVCVGLIEGLSNWV
jgi:hypothetical protein